MFKSKERAETSARSFQCSSAALNRGAAAVLQQLRLQGGGEALQGGGALLDTPRLPGQPGLPRGVVHELGLKWIDTLSFQEAWTKPDPQDYFQAPFDLN